MSCRVLGLLLALQLVGGCSLNPQPLPPDSPMVDSGALTVGAPTATDSGAFAGGSGAGGGGKTSSTGSEPSGGGVNSSEGGSTATGPGSPQPDAAAQHSISDAGASVEGGKDGGKAPPDGGAPEGGPDAAWAPLDSGDRLDGSGG